MPLRPKYLLIDRLRENITLSGRRWKPHGSSKEGGKEAGSKEARKEGGSKEEIIFAVILHIFSQRSSPDTGSPEWTFETRQIRSFFSNRRGATRNGTLPG
jgi:hypothetical protein